MPDGDCGCWIPALVEPYNVEKDSSNVCPDYSIGFKLEKSGTDFYLNPEFLDDGTYCDSTGTNCVYIDFYHVGSGSDINAFNFKDANFIVEEVVVKAGSTENHYNYTYWGFTDVKADNGLLSPEGKTISHMNFCGIPTPEFPTLALPVGMVIGFVGLVYVTKKREN